MQVELRVRSCSTEWEDIMRPLDETGRSRRRDRERVFTSFLEIGPNYPSGDLFEISGVTVKTAQPLVVGSAYRMTIEEVESNGSY